LDKLFHDTDLSDTIPYNSLVKIDDTHFMLAFTDDSGGDGWVKTFSIDGSYNVTEIDSFEYDISAGERPNLIQLDSTHFVAAHQITPQIGTDDGYVTTFAVDGIYNINKNDTLEHAPNGGGASNALVKIDDTHFMLAYSGGGNDGFIKTFSVDVSYNITQIDSLEHDTSFGFFHSLAQIDSTHYMLAYQGGAGSTGIVKTFSIDESYIITQVDVLVHDTLTNSGLNNSLVKIDDTHFMLAYETRNNRNVVTTFSIDGSYNITEIDSLEHDDVLANVSNSLVQMSSTNYMLAYTGPDTDGFIRTFSIDGSYNITQRATTEFDTTQASFNSLVQIDSSHYILAYLSTSTNAVITTFGTSTSELLVSTTDSPTSVGTSTATIAGNITEIELEYSPTARGFTYGTNASLSGGDTATTTEYGSFNTGSFTADITGLVPITTYYYRAFAATSTATTTGSIVSFDTPAISLVGESSVQRTSASTAWSHSHSLPAGGVNKGLLIGVFVTGAESTHDVTAVSYDGTGATELTSAFGGTADPGISVWWMPEVDLPSGGSTYTLSVTHNTAEVGNTVITLFEGVSQDQPTNVDAIYQIDQDASDHTESLTGVSVGNLVVAYLNDEGAPSTTSVSDGVEIYDSNDTEGTCGLEGDCFIASNSGSGTVGVTWTNTSPSGSWEKTTAIVELEYATTTPTVETNAASSITVDSATLNGDITVIFKENANERGFAWGTESDLSGGDTATTTNFGDFSTGAFTEALSSLNSGTTYYFRAFAANSVGTSTGSILNFTTDSAPTVTTNTASAVTNTSATLNGTITNTGGDNADEVGFAWGTESNLSGGDTATTSQFGADNWGAESFSAAIEDLVKNTTYYFRAYAANSVGTTTASIQSFTALTPSRRIRLFEGTRLKIRSGKVKIE